MIKVLVFILMSSLSMASDEFPLKSVNGVSCGVEIDPNVEVVGVGKTTYLYSVNKVEKKQDQLNLDFKLEFLVCSKANNKFFWSRFRQPVGIYSYTQRIYPKNDKWIEKGFWDTTSILATDESLVYRTEFKNWKLSKLMTKEEFRKYQNGETIEIFLKLDLGSDKYAYYIDGFMVLKLTVSKTLETKLEFLN